MQKFENTITILANVPKSDKSARFHYILRTVIILINASYCCRFGLAVTRWSWSTKLLCQAQLS